MNIFGFIGKIFKPAADLVDNLHTSSEEKLELRNKLAEMQFEFQSKVLEYETKIMEARASVINSEVKSGSWLAQNWRPILMLTFGALVVSRWLGYSAPNLTPELELELMSMIKLGMTGYIVGRSAEKVIKEYKK